MPRARNPRRPHPPPESVAPDPVVAEAPAPAPQPTAAPPTPEGPMCPSCHCRHLPVYATRHRLNFTIRIRFCRHCGRRVVTRELVIGAVSVH